MKPLPVSDNSLLIRTDFSSPEIWASLRDRLTQPHGIFRASFVFVDDPAYAGLTRDDLLALDENQRPVFVYIADAMTMTHPDHPVLILDLFENNGVQFRAVPSEVPAIENNLSLGNMDAEDFADNAGPDGIFRGFEP